MTTFNMPCTIDIEQAVRDDINKQLGQSMQEDIDFDIISKILVSDGWTKVELDRFENNRHAVDVITWVEENCTGKYLRRGVNFVFERPEDATWFILKYS